MRADLSKQEGERTIEILSFATNLEHIGDIIDRNLMVLAAKKKQAGELAHSRLWKTDAA